MIIFWIGVCCGAVLPHEQALLKGGGGGRHFGPRPPALACLTGGAGQHCVEARAGFNRVGSAMAVNAQFLVPPGPKLLLNFSEIASL
jgi:hypothetical protein